MADKGNDPAVIWQTMIGEMEKGFNSFANQAMASPEFSKVMNQVGGVTAGAQKQLGEMIRGHLATIKFIGGGDYIKGYEVYGQKIAGGPVKPTDNAEKPIEATITVENWR